MVCFPILHPTSFRPSEPNPSLAQKQQKTLFPTEDRHERGGRQRGGEAAAGGGEARRAEGGDGRCFFFFLVFAAAPPQTPPRRLATPLPSPRRSRFVSLLLRHRCFSFSFPTFAQLMSCETKLATTMYQSCSCFRLTLIRA